MGEMGGWWDEMSEVGDQKQSEIHRLFREIYDHYESSHKKYIPQYKVMQICSYHWEQFQVHATQLVFPIDNVA